MSHEELMMVFKIAIVPLVVAFGLSIAIAAILRKRKTDAETAPTWPGIIAIGIGMLAGQIAYFGVPIPASVRLVEGWQWVLAFAAAALVLLPASSLPRPREWLGEGIRIVLFAGFVFMAVRALAAMERSTMIAWMVGSPIVCGIWATALARCGERAAGRLWPGILAVVCTVSAITLFLLNSATHFFLTAALAASLGGVFFSQAILRRRPRLFSSAGGNYPLLLLSGFCLVHALYLEDVPLHALVILLAAPWGVLIGWMPGIRGRHKALVMTLQFLVVAAILAAAFVPVYLNYEPDPYAGY